MAEIPVSTVVNVTIGVAPTFPSRKGFGTLNILGVSSVIGIIERSRMYTNPDDVAADFPADSEEVKASKAYFAQVPRPVQLVISRRVGAPIGAELRGGANILATLSDWRAITAGSLKVSIGGVATDVTGLDFATANNLPGVAAVIQTAIRALTTPGAPYTQAVVTYKGGRFYLTSGNTGESATVGYAEDAATGTPIAGFLQWQLGDGARVSNGSDTETLAQALTASQDANQDWYGAAFTAETRAPSFNDQWVEAAAWTQARVKMLAYDTEDRTNLDPLNNTSVAYQLDQAKYDRTLGVFNDTPGDYGAVSALARLFTVNYNTANSAITLKFKQLPGVTVANIYASEKAALDAVHLNAYVNVGGNSMLAEGVMFGGRFADEVHGIDWLQNAVETNVFGKLYTDTTKTAMTDSGAASLQQQVEKGLDQAILNGLGAPGYLNDGTYLAKGYRTDVVKIEDHNQSDKERRIGPPITFVLIGAGAIHSVQVNGTFQR